MTGRASEKRHRIEILTLTKTADGQGGYASVWATYDTRWAKVKTIKALEQYKSLQVDNPLEVIFWLRWDKNITDEMRVRFNKNVYEVLGLVNVDEMNVELEISARKLRAKE